MIFLSAFLWVPGNGEAETMPIREGTAISATARAIVYRNLTGSTLVGFRSTGLLPQAQGSAKVKNRDGAMWIKAKFQHLEPAGRFGMEYLTYVLWAVTPVGRPVNLGEVIAQRNGKAELKTHTSLQTFGLIVTAEPHFAVTQVSDRVVLTNVVTKETRGQVEEMEARYEALSRGTQAAPTLGLRDPKVSPYVYQAVNAMDMAREAGAQRFAPEAFQKVVGLMSQLEAVPKTWKKPAIILARQLVQQAEDARLLAVKNREQAEQERQWLEAEQARKDAEAARAEADRTRNLAEAVRQEEERARLQTSQDARKAREREVSAEVLAVRKRLKEQLSRLLETRETERGVEVSLSDLLFPSGKDVLLPATREKLARIAGIVLTYPGVRVSVEGHTDSTGTEALNQRLSLRRAQAVRGLLLRQGLAPATVTAQGFGAGSPVASNETLAGRQQNRRVELILTGGGIGF
jgi:outer membrane protein OmpA-like peptidoglycan-associated protein